MQLRLACVGGPCEGRVAALGQGSHLLGRSSEAVVGMGEDDAVSAKHAMLVVRPGAVLVADLDSHNGTYLNGVRLRVPTQLMPGDCLRLGSSEWQLAESAVPPEVSPSTASTATAEASQPRLQITVGSRAGEVITLPAGKAFTVGRDPGCDLVLDDSVVSREHATFFRQPEQVTVLDHDSSNGVRVNGVPIRLEPLRDGDVVEIGRHRFRFLATGSEPPPLTGEDTTDPLQESHAESAPPPPVLASPPLGQFGPFLLLAEVGRGGMGRVFSAHRPDQQPVALKLVIFKGLDAARANRRRRRFEREVVVLRRIQHENVVGFREAGVVDGRPYLAMELLEGPDLASELQRRQKLTYQEAERILFQLCAAVGAVHEAKIIHRDLKPSNVILHGREATVKLTDFGIARPLDQEDLEGDQALLAAWTELAVTGEGRHPGTPLYMAPEQIRGEALDMRSDIWALGVVLYQLLSGRHPFPGRTAREVMQRIESAAPLELSDEIPPAIRSAVYRCLLKPPAWRFASAIELMDALHERRLDQLFPVGDRPAPARPLIACPHCQARIAAGRERCPLCHADLSVFASGRLRQQLVDGRALSGCGRCGQQVRPTDPECPRCQHQFGRRATMIGPTADLTDTEAERLALGLARLKGCPHCGASVESGAVSCDFCGLLVRAHLIGRIAMRKDVTGESLVCGACREPLREPRDTRCRGCGLNFESGKLPNGKAWHETQAKRGRR